MTGLFVWLIGLATVCIAAWVTFVTFRDAKYRARGYRLIQREKHPVMFFVNAVGIVLFGAVGAAMILWALMH